MKSITAEFLAGQIQEVSYQRGIGTLTHCYITVKNGFVFTGESSCVSAENFDEKVGQEIAYANAFDKMWSHYGFWLTEKLHKEGGTPIDRMQIEVDDLDKKLLKLEAFIHQGKPNFLTEDEWQLLHQQAEYMMLYRGTLECRLDIAKSKK